MSIGLEKNTALTVQCIWKGYAVNDLVKSCFIKASFQFVIACAAYFPAKPEESNDLQGILDLELNDLPDDSHVTERSLGNQVPVSTVPFGSSCSVSNDKRSARIIKNSLKVPQQAKLAKVQVQASESDLSTSA
jgi:hypothetical protein